MSTNNYSTVLEHSSDATFRAWGSALAAALAAVGLTQTSDTGQINWTTVTRPGTSTAAGYEIWRFNDTLQATAPIFLKIEYGTGTTALAPTMWITVGTGSNGSGTITGQSSTRTQFGRNSAPVSTAVPYPTYVCYNATEGFLGIAFKIGSQGSTAWVHAFAAIARNVDQDDGDTNGTGCSVYTADTSTGPANMQPIRFTATAATYLQNSNFCVVPNLQTASLVGSDNQAYMHFTVNPQVFVVKQLCTIISSEVPLGNTFTATMVADAKTYIGFGQNGPGGNVSGGTTQDRTIAMLWE